MARMVRPRRENVKNNNAETSTPWTQYRSEKERKAQKEVGGEDERPQRAVQPTKKKKNVMLMLISCEN